ncbi:MAG TPA: proton-conducting transporter membrane subunit [Candidatus Limnocylindrales bacterium]|nr:proton-conducting transporter membrane subunit [Candidatus Limnocylindrales bacterium]
MTVVPFLVVAVLAGAGSLVLRAHRGWSTLIAVAGLLGMTATAAAMTPGTTLEIGGTVLTVTAWLRLYALLGSIVGLGLVAIDVAAMHEPDVPGVIVIGLGSAVLALGIPNAGVAVMAATAGGLAGVLVAAPVGAAARSAFVGVRELRALAVAATLAILATAWLARPLSDLAAQPAVFSLAYLAFGTAVAIRFGAIPFHLWAARLADAAPGVALPLLMAWSPAAFAAVALVWIDQSVAPLVLPLATERALIGAVGAVSVVLGLLAAWVQDDLEHVVGYSIIADAGVAVLGLAALDPATWEPARTWLLVFVVGRSAFAAWVVAIHGGFGTRRLPELAGWARRAPVLALSLVLIAIASIGWPGFVAWQARSALIQLALPGPIALLVTIAPIGAAAIYGRMLLVGIRLPGAAVAEGRGERPEWPEPVDREPIAAIGPARDGRRLFRASGAAGGVGDLVRLIPAGGRANRMPLAAIAVLLLSGLALLVAGGGLGVPEAARAIPEALPVASSGPITPGESAGPGANPGPSASQPANPGPSFAPVP